MSVPRLSIFAIVAKTRFQRFDLASEVSDAIRKSEIGIEDGDIFVVSSKYAAISEGRLVKLSTVNVGRTAKSLAEIYRMDPALAQIVVEESDEILGGVNGFVLSLVSGTLAPNAGIDRSNVPEGWAVPYPRDPQYTASDLREKLLTFANGNGKVSRIQNLGVVLSDSRVTPTRLGTVGVAVSYAGLKPTIDMRGTPDLFGKNLLVTLRAIADQLATAAQLVMGESKEGRPIAIVRGFTEAFSEPRTEFEKRTTIPPDQCLIISSLKNPFLLSGQVSKFS